MNNPINIITSDKNWLEPKAIEQLRQVAALPGVVQSIGLPDLHPGKTPVGAAFITEGIIYPHLIGNDIGCGMSLFQTEIEHRKFGLDRMTKRLEGVSLDRIDSSGASISAPSTLFDRSLGTVGGGNHFAEFQMVHAIHDYETFDGLGMEENRIALLVHSGSRGFGRNILERFIFEHQAQHGLAIGTPGFAQYLAEHDQAVAWAHANRRLIGHRILKALGLKPELSPVLESMHNALSPMDIGNATQFIHRKGAAPYDPAGVIIPGSRGSLTYLVVPTGDAAITGYSLAHGAGRKWDRNVCQTKLLGKYTKDSIRTTRLKSRVVCDEPRLLFEEAPEAYKNIDTVIQTLIDWGLAKVVATFKPLLTYKN